MREMLVFELFRATWRQDSVAVSEILDRLKGVDQELHEVLCNGIMFFE